MLHDAYFMVIGLRDPDNMPYVPEQISHPLPDGFISNRQTGLIKFLVDVNTNIHAIHNISLHDTVRQFLTCIWIFCAYFVFTKHNEVNQVYDYIYF